MIIPRVDILSAATITPEPIRWVWPGWLARGKLHVLAGAPGTGKTTIALSIAAAVSAGRALPSGWTPQLGSILIWSGEDDPADTLVPRLLAAGACLERVHFVGDVRRGLDVRAFDAARDVPALAIAASAIPDLALILVDPLVSAIAGDSHKNAEVRRGLQPLVELASGRDAALIGISHLSKGTQGRDPLERVTGSVAFGALARIVLGTARQESKEGEQQRFTIARTKSNVGADGGGFSYGIEPTELTEYPGVSTSRIVWGVAMEGSARQLLADADTDESTTDSASFLCELLGRGSVATNGIFADAKGAGFSVDQMKRAKRRVGAVAFKDGMRGAWYWRLPNAEERAEASEGGIQKRPPSTHSSEGKSLPSSDAFDGFEQ